MIAPFIVRILLKGSSLQENNARRNYYTCMVAYFCHHLSDNYVDLSDIYVDLSDLYIDLSDNYVDLSEKYHHN